MKRGRSAGALLAIMAAACTAGPDYHVPQTAVARAPHAQQRFDAGSEPAFAQAPVPDHWWRLYDDPRLDAYVTTALAANADLRAADANLRRATAVVREAEAARAVQTGISGGAAATQAGNFSFPTATGYGYSLGLSLAYPLDLAGGIRRGIEAARADAEATVAARDQVRIVVAAGVTRSYAAACSANATLAATTGVLNLLRQTLDVTRRLQQGGRGTAFDVTRAQAAVDQSAATIPAILAARQAALYELAALMGRVPSDYPREATGCTRSPLVRTPLPVGDGAALIRRRPDIRRAERSLAAATAQIGVEVAQLYPQVSLGGSAGIAGPFSTFGTSATFGGSIGPLVSWSFPNRAATRARIAQAGAGADAAAAQFDAVVLAALQQAETALSAYARELDRHHDLAAARDSAARAADQAGRLYRFGRTDFLSLLTAQANLATAEATLAQSQAVLVDRQIDVFLALGGGWG